MVVKFHVDAGIHELFKDMVESAHSPFYKKDMKEVFIFAMALGFHLKRRKELKKKKDIADINVFSHSQKLLIKSIATMAEGKPEVLINETRPIEIAEEFANGGIDDLYNWVFRVKEEPVKVLDKKITELVKKK